MFHPEYQSCGSSLWVLPYQNPDFLSVYEYSLFSVGVTVMPISSVLKFSVPHEDAMTAAAASEINALDFISNIFLSH